MRTLGYITAVTTAAAAAKILDMVPPGPPVPSLLADFRARRPMLEHNSRGAQSCRARDPARFMCEEGRDFRSRSASNRV